LAENATQPSVNQSVFLSGFVIQLFDKPKAKCGVGIHKVKNFWNGVLKARGSSQILKRFSFRKTTEQRLKTSLENQRTLKSKRISWLIGYYCWSLRWQARWNSYKVQRTSLVHVAKKHNGSNDIPL